MKPVSRLEAHVQADDPGGSRADGRRDPGTLIDQQRRRQVRDQAGKMAHAVTLEIAEDRTYYTANVLGKAWQGKPEFDESSQIYAIQLSVPVLAEGKPIGVLVVGVNLEKIAKK